MSDEECVMGELSCYYGYNQPEIKYSPLEWWKGHCKVFPYLSVLAKKYLSVLQSVAPSERVFSTSGNIATAKCNCLKPDKVDIFS